MSFLRHFIKDHLKKFCQKPNGKNPFEPSMTSLGCQRPEVQNKWWWNSKPTQKGHSYRCLIPCATIAYTRVKIIAVEDWDTSRCRSCGKCDCGTDLQLGLRKCKKWVDTNMQTASAYAFVIGSIVPKAIAIWPLLTRDIISRPKERTWKSFPSYLSQTKGVDPIKLVIHSKLRYQFSEVMLGLHIIIS